MLQCDQPVSSPARIRSIHPFERKACQSRIERAGVRAISNVPTNRVRSRKSGAQFIPIIPHV